LRRPGSGKLGPYIAPGRPADRTKVPYKLLLADDSVTIQRVIELTFADEDIQVIAVSDGDQAIARLDADPPDIVLADVGMPGRDGYEVAAYIKQSPLLSHIPVVLLTGAFEPVDQTRANAVGCDGVLAKPFEPQLVIGRVKELLGRPGRSPMSLDANLAPPIAAADAWAAPLIDQPFHAPLDPAQPAGAAGDAYFDRLDAAFANLSGSPPSSPAPAKLAADDAVDWFGSKPGPPADLPLSYASPQPAFESPAPRKEPAPPRSQPVAGPPGPAPAREPGPRPTLPPLADAFAALLAAEQSTPASAGAPMWPAAVPVITDDLVEQITRRVLDRLSDRVVRETVSDIVSEIAERLVREEIERIKSTIK